MDIHSQQTVPNPLWDNHAAVVDPRCESKEGNISSSEGLWQNISSKGKEVHTTHKARVGYHGREWMLLQGKGTVVASKQAPTVLQVLYVLFWAFFAALVTSGGL